MLNQTHLRHFLLAAREGSITRGAERGAVSQPAVSRAIAELENEVGAKLFHRAPKGVQITDSGRVLLTYAERIFELEREAQEALSDISSLRAGRLRIGASTTIGDYLMPPVIVAFLEKYPDVKLSMHVANTEAIQAGVIEGRFDIGFSEGGSFYTNGSADASPPMAPGRQSGSALRLRPLHRVEHEELDISILCSDELVLIASSPRSLDLANARFVMREAGSGTRKIVADAFLDRGLPLQVACELGSTSAIKLAVSAGLGIGIVSRLSVETELAKGDLVVIESDLQLRRDLHIVRMGWRRESAALREFMKILRRRVQQM